MVQTSLTGRTTKGFTLIELLVVIAIIALLAAILFPVFARAREKARQTQCQSNQRQIAAALQMYVQDHDETFPDSSTLWGAIQVDPGVLVCPTLGKGVANGYTINEDICNMGLGSFSDPSNCALTTDGKLNNSTWKGANNIATDPTDVQPRHSSKAIASFMDGHVAPLAMPFFAALWGASGGAKVAYQLGSNPAGTDMGGSWIIASSATQAGVVGDGYTGDFTLQIGGTTNASTFPAPCAAGSTAGFIVGVNSTPVAPGNTALTANAAVSNMLFGVDVETTAAASFVVNNGTTTINTSGTAASSVCSAIPLAAAAGNIYIERRGSRIEIFDTNSSTTPIYDSNLQVPTITCTKKLYPVIAFTAATGAAANCQLFGYARK